jgi:hypothetical protein
VNLREFITTESIKQKGTKMLSFLRLRRGWNGLVVFSQDFHPSFDYLFVDEAGQVSIANIVAMATCAKNAVLVGDQCSSLSPPSAGWI